MILTFNKEIYPKIALIKAAYNYTDRAYLHLDATDSHYTVEIIPKDNSVYISEMEFVNEMLCQCTRHAVYEQTKEVRELLLARSFASSLIERSQFDTNDIPDADIDEEQVLTDWFEAHDNT